MSLWKKTAIIDGTVYDVKNSEFVCKITEWYLLPMSRKVYKAPNGQFFIYSFGEIVLYDSTEDAFEDVMRFMSRNINRAKQTAKKFFNKELVTA